MTLLLELLEYIWEHPGEITLNAVLLLLLRKFIMSEVHKLLHMGRDGELRWIRERVERLTGEKYDGQPAFLRTVRNRYIGKFYFYSRTEIGQGEGKLKTLISALTSSFSKKLAALVITAAISALNNKFGLELNSETIYGLYAVTIAYIAGQSHVDAKRLISQATNSLATAVTESAATTDGSPIQTITTMPMSYNEMIPYLNEITKDLTDVYDALKSGRYNDQTQRALNIAMTVHEYLKSQNKEA